MPAELTSRPERQARKIYIHVVDDVVLDRHVLVRLEHQIGRNWIDAFDTLLFADEVVGATARAVGVVRVDPLKLVVMVLLTTEFPWTSWRQCRHWCGHRVCQRSSEPEREERDRAWDPPARCSRCCGKCERGVGGRLNPAQVDVFHDRVVHYSISVWADACVFDDPVAGIDVGSAMLTALVSVGCRRRL